MIDVPLNAGLRPVAHGETILFVEDYSAVRVSVAKTLRRLNYSVLEAPDAATARAAATHHVGKIDLLITDVVLPDGDGIDLARQVAELHPALRVLYLSGQSYADMAQHGVRMEEVAFLHKPFTSAELAAKIRETLDW